MERIDSRSRMIVAEQSARAHGTPGRQQSRQQVHDHHHHHPHDHEHEEGCGHDHDHHHDHGHSVGGQSDVEMQIRMLHSGASGGKKTPGHQAPVKKRQQPVRGSGGSREPYQVSGM